METTDAQIIKGINQYRLLIKSILNDFKKVIFKNMAAMFDFEKYLHHKKYSTIAMEALK